MKDGGLLLVLMCALAVTTEAGQNRGFQLELDGLSEHGYVDKDYTFKCVDRNSTQAIRWFKNEHAVATITRSSCFTPSEYSEILYNYTCDADGYMLTIPAEKMKTKMLNGTVWSCKNTAGGLMSNHKTL